MIEGLSPEGGLYIPQEIPKVTEEQLSKWKDLEFYELATEIMSLYVSQTEIPKEDLLALTKKSYSTFRHKDVTPFTQLKNQEEVHVLELFHGPTYAFKDVALQFVGNLFEYFLSRRNQGKSDSDPSRDFVTVIGATSGDTGSAAIYGLRNKKDVSVFILYPTGRVSPIQEMQMTTVLDKNVHTISVKGTFDDCQDLVKQSFSDRKFNEEVHVAAVNSINWARILAQITYYYYSYFQIKRQNPNKKLHYVVPTGNFGDILAGFYAKQMGLGIDELVIATNENDILYRFFQSGDYSSSVDGKAPVVHATLSPAMDILVSSNFERFLWHVTRETVADSDVAAGKLVAEWMASLKSKGTFTVPEKLLSAAKKHYSAERTDDAATVATIKKVYETVSPKYVIDPHSAVAISAALERISETPSTDIAYVCLSTAHPAKFDEAVNKALVGLPGYSFEDEVLPEEFKKMMGAKSKKIFLEKADIDEVKSVIKKELSKIQPGV